VPRISILIEPNEATRLSELARAERRRPADQAAVILARELNKSAPLAKEPDANAS
jgi:hypothetical protein